MRLPTTGVLLLAVFMTTAHAQPAAKPDPNKTVPVQIRWDQKVPMRDGVKLSATIYRDPKQKRPLPAIVMLTPYIAAHAAKQGVYFAQNGYVFVAVDSRGRGNSDGVFLPGQVEGKDGHDVVEWAAKQPWCDGKVATWGGSWLGFTQWSIAKEFPPHLKAMVPTASVYPGVDYPHQNGIFMSYMLRWLTFVHGRALNDGLFRDNGNELWTNAEWEQIASGRPFQDLEELVGARGTVFRTWLDHPREDSFWQAMTPRPEDFAKLEIPILTITGHYDDDQLGALTYYDRHMARGTREAKARHWLVIGPWDHAGTRRPKEELGGVAFGAGAVTNMEELHKRWYDHVLKGGPPPELLKDRVACFIMNRNEWVHASDLGQLEGAPLVLQLDAAGAAAGDVTRSGRLLTHAPAGSAGVTMIADPRYMPPRDQLDVENPTFLRDQRSAYVGLPSQSIWHSAPFGTETVLSGRPRVRLRVTTDQPDADLRVELFEVLADGTSVLLSNSRTRLRYRRGTLRGTNMTPGRPEQVEVPGMSLFARAIAKGSRLRLIVDAGPSWGWQRNSHTGGDLVTEPTSRGRIARVTILTGRRGSTLELPRPSAAILGRKTKPAGTEKSRGAPGRTR